MGTTGGELKELQLGIVAQHLDGVGCSCRGGKRLRRGNGCRFPVNGGSLCLAAIANGWKARFDGSKVVLLAENFRSQGQTGGVRAMGAASPAPGEGAGGCDEREESGENDVRAHGERWFTERRLWWNERRSSRG
jgi:hypothetical protein